MATKKPEPYYSVTLTHKGVETNVVRVKARRMCVNHRGDLLLGNQVSPYDSFSNCTHAFRSGSWTQCILETEDVPIHS